MRFRVTPTPDVASEIKRVEKKDLIELMRRAAIRMADGDVDEHIERSVVWEGHSEEFSRWLVREVRASFDAFSWAKTPKTTLEIAARAASRLAILVVLFLVAQLLMSDRDSTVTLIFMGPIMLLTFLYGLGFLVSVARLVNRLLGKDAQEQEEGPPESR